MKFGRTYRLEVEGQTKSHVLELPLTLTFEVARACYSMAQVARFSLNGLSESSRKDIFQDRYHFRDLSSKNRLKLKFSAGYESQAMRTMIFSGYITLAYTQRSGAELITYIEAQDNAEAIARSSVSKSVKGSWNYIGTLKSLMETMREHGAEPGDIVVSDPPSTKDSAVFSGNTWQELMKYVPEGGQLFFDNGKIHLLGPNDTVLSTNGVNVIRARDLNGAPGSGLLNIPIITGYTVTCSTLFEPGLLLGQAVTLVSDLLPKANGLYKVTGIQHHGTISGVDSGDAVTDLILQSVRTGKQA